MYDVVMTVVLEGQFLQYQVVVCHPVCLSGGSPGNHPLKYGTYNGGLRSLHHFSRSQKPEKVTNYAWANEKSKVKIYVPQEGCSEIDDANISLVRDEDRRPCQLDTRAHKQKFVWDPHSIHHV